MLATEILYLIKTQSSYFNFIDKMCWTRLAISRFKVFKGVAGVTHGSIALLPHI